MKISILIPAYKPNLKLMYELFDSIISTNIYKPEIIVGIQSDEDLSDAISKYGIKVIKYSKPSLYLTKLSLMSFASGDYIIFSDCDDLFVPGAIDELINIIDIKKADLFIYKIFDFTNVPRKEKCNININKCKSLNKSDAYEHFCMGDTIRFESPSKCFRKNIVRNSDFPNVDVFQGEDVIISTILIKNASNICLIDEDLYQYRKSQTRGSVQVNPKYLYDNLTVISTVFDSSNNYTLYLVKRIFLQFCNTLYLCPNLKTFSFSNISNIYYYEGFEILLEFAEKTCKMADFKLVSTREKFLRFYFLLFAKKKWLICTLLNKVGKIYRKINNRGNH